MLIDRQSTPPDGPPGGPEPAKLIELSRTCAIQGRLDAALELAEGACAAAAPGDVLAVTHLGWVLHRRGEYGRAQAAFRVALARDVGSRTIRTLLADSLIAQRVYADALEVLAPLRTSQGSGQAATDTARRVVQCLLGLGDTAAARAELLKHLDLDPGHLGLLDLYRRMTCAEGRPLAAAEAYLRGAASRSDGAAHLASAIDLLIEASQLERAIAIGEQSIGQGQRGDRLLRALINAYLIAGRHAHAMRVARLALEAAPGAEYYWRIVLSCAVRLEDVDAAEQAALRTLESQAPYMGAEIEWIVERLKRDRARAQDFVRNLLRLRPLEPWVAILGPRVGLRLDERYSRRAAAEHSIEISGADSCWDYMSRALQGLRHRGYEGERSRPPERPVNLFHLRDVRLCVLPHGFFVLARSGDPFDHFAPHLHDAMVDQARSMSPSGSFERLFFVGDRHAPHNYAHWTLDYLPRAAVADAVAPDFMIGVPHMRSGGFHAETLRGLRIDPARCVPLAAGVYEVDDLMFLNASSQESSHAFHGGNRHYASVMLSRPPEEGSGRGRRVFLDRAPGTTRQIVNRREVMSVLDRFGVEPVDPGTLPPLGQIDLIRSADVIIGPHGAGLANIAYSRPGTRVLELWHPVLGNPAFVKTAFVAGARYSFMLTSAASVEAAGNANPVLANYVIDCAALGEWLEAET